jgi:hypothetical protein
MSENIRYHIVFVVCHPDDEALWVGGIIHSLSQFPAISVDVICLSGADAESPREQEFLQAKIHGGYHCGIVMGGRLRAATDPLPDTSKTVEIGLEKLGLDASKVSLLITHSPYGDERMHPHHRQASKELHAWTIRQNIPFGYFTCLPLPTGCMQPLLTNMKRLGALHLLNLSRCKYSTVRKLFSHFLGKSHFFPKYYLQFLTDAAVKNAMLCCYPSTDLKLFENGYSMFTNNCESICLFGDRGLEAIQYAIEQMEIPGEMNLFLDIASGQTGLHRIASLARRVVSRILIGKA